MLNWAQQFNIFCFLDNCQYTIQPHSYECLLAVGAKAFLSADAATGFSGLDHFINASQDWCFGHLSYHLNPYADLIASTHTDAIGFPDFYFFKPHILLLIKDNQLVIYANEPKYIYQALQKESEHNAADILPNITTQSRLTRQQYIRAVQAIQRHIQRGDCYELNFCQEFFATDVSVNPTLLFKRLMAISPNPFSAFYRLNDQYLICASPERFLTKSDDIVLSQPIKGTAKRSSDKDTDNRLKEELYYSPKERAENVMVVDLVRNDLSKICKEASVKVDELYGIYSFPQVHQMISTISGALKPGISLTDIIKATFPMGSMTGAPKKKVMELIAEYEVSNRGIFSGAVGYIDGNKDFDFNVVIRSLMYNAASQYLSYQVGSGITFYSDAEKEWEECLLKAEAIKKVVNHDLPD